MPREASGLTHHLVALFGLVANGADVAHVVEVKSEDGCQPCSNRGFPANSIVPVGEPLPEQALDTAVDPEIVQQSFDTERRGFDQRQVQEYLRAVADSLRDAQQREADMRTRLGRGTSGRNRRTDRTRRRRPTTLPSSLRQFGDQVASVLDAAASRRRTTHRCRREIRRTTHGQRQSRSNPDPRRRRNHHGRTPQPKPMLLPPRSIASRPGRSQCDCANRHDRCRSSRQAAADRVGQYATNATD